MATKIKTITLASYERLPDSGSSPRHLVRTWRVTKITDSTEYYPGQELSKKEVESLCEAKDWKVTITALPGL